MPLKLTSRHITNTITAILITGLLGFYQNLNAQNIKEDLQKINDHYYKLEKLDIDLTYSAFESHDALSPVKTEKATIKTNGKNQYFKINQLETLITENYYMSVDHQKKFILISRIYSKKEKSESPQFMIDLEASIRLCNKTQHKIIDKNTSLYTLWFPSGEYEFIEIYFNPNTYLLNKLLLYYRYPTDLSIDKSNKNPGKPKMEIHYNKIDPDPRFNQNEFSYLKYLYPKDEGLVAKPPFDNYELIDQFTGF